MKTLEDVIEETLLINIVDEVENRLLNNVYDLVEDYMFESGKYEETDTRFLFEHGRITSIVMEELYERLEDK